MLAKGWLCSHINSAGIYTFQPTENLEQVIRIDYQQELRKEKKATYKQLHEDFGWRIVKEKSYDGTFIGQK